MKYLFEKGYIGKLEIKNRAVMPAMGTNMSAGGKVNLAIINHYAQRAKGGVGLIIVEVTCVDAPLGLNTPDMLRIDTDEFIEGHKKLTDAIHNNGAKVMLQLSHTGRGAKPDVIGAQPVGPSAVAMPFSFMMGLKGVEPKALSVDEIKKIEDKYAEAALRAKKAGYDGVEIHACGYYLCQQFLSSQANVRTDEYGGTKEKRVRFVTKIISKTKELCNEEFPVIVKISVLELGKEAGIKLNEGLYYSFMMQKAGADAIEVLAGAWNEKAGMRDKPETGQRKGIALPLCTLLNMAKVTKTGKVNLIAGKKAIKVPLIGGGRSFEPAIVEKALAKQCDFVFMGRGQLCEPNLVNLMEEEKFELARPCIGCNQC
ncbi:MAG: NADH:flavin oxidoreductase, partial [Eubacteriales bacterium]